MGFSPEQVTRLEAPLSASHVKQREQGRSKVSYIEGWHAISEANAIFGFDAWSRETISIQSVSEKPRKIGKGEHEKDGWGVTYIAQVRIRVDGIVREGVGAGHGIDADLGQAHESAIKEAETDAMKRALMTFGNPFGLALYDKTQANVEKEAQTPPKPDPNAAKADKVVASAITHLSPMSAFEMAEWYRAADPKTVEAMKWVKKNFPEKWNEVQGLGFDVEV